MSYFVPVSPSQTWTFWGFVAKWQFRKSFVFRHLRHTFDKVFVLWHTEGMEKIHTATLTRLICQKMKGVGYETI
jgi:hypothetical protein